MEFKVRVDKAHARSLVYSLTSPVLARRIPVWPSRRLRNASPRPEVLGARCAMIGYYSPYLVGIYRTRALILFWEHLNIAICWQLITF